MVGGGLGFGSLGRCCAAVQGELGSSGAGWRHLRTATRLASSPMLLACKRVTQRSDHSAGGSGGSGGPPDPGAPAIQRQCCAKRTMQRAAEGGAAKQLGGRTCTAGPRCVPHGQLIEGALASDSNPLAWTMNNVQPDWLENMCYSGAKPAKSATGAEVVGWVPLGPQPKRPQPGGAPAGPCQGRICAAKETVWQHSLDSASGDDELEWKMPGSQLQLPTWPRHRTRASDGAAPATSRRLPRVGGRPSQHNAEGRLVQRSSIHLLRQRETRSSVAEARGTDS